MFATQQSISRGIFFLCALQLTSAVLAMYYAFHDINYCEEHDKKKKLPVMLILYSSGKFAMVFLCGIYALCLSLAKLNENMLHCFRGVYLSFSLADTIFMLVWYIITMVVMDSINYECLTTTDVGIITLVQYICFIVNFGFIEHYCNCDWVSVQNGIDYSPRRLLV